MPQPTPASMTPAETRLAEALVSLVDYTGRILLAGLANNSPHYVQEKADALAEVAGRLADLAAPAAQGCTSNRIRLDVVARAVAIWSQSYTAGQRLFPRTGEQAEGRPMNGYDRNNLTVHRVAAVVFADSKSTGGDMASADEWDIADQIGDDAQEWNGVEDTRWGDASRDIDANATIIRNGQSYRVTVRRER